MRTMRDSKVLRMCAVILAFMLVFTSIPMNSIVYAAAKKPGQVKNLQLSSATKTSLKVKWKKSANAKSYQVAYKKLDAKSYTTKKTSNLNYTISSLKSGVTYKVRVRAINGNTYGKWSAVKQFKTKKASTPTQVKNVKLSNSTKISLKVKWVKAKYAQKYQVAYKKSSAKKFTLKKTSNLSYTISSLSSGTTYKVKVRAINGSKYGKWSTVKSFKTKTAATPAQVKNVALSNSAKTSLKVKWAKVKYAEKYQVAYKKSSAKSYTLKKTSNLNYTISSLSSGTTYQVKVRAINGSKYGKWSTVKSFKTKVSSTPTQVKNVNLSKATADTLTIKWDKAKYAKKYQIAYKKADAKDYTTKNTTDLIYTISKLEEKTTYNVKVRAINGSKYGKWSSVQKVETKAVPAKKPAQVKKLSLSTAKATTLKVQWEKASDAKKYQVAYKKVGTKKYSYVTTESRSYTISNLKSDSPYYVKVRGVNGTTYGTWSTVNKYATKVDYTQAVDENKVKVSVGDESIKIQIADLGLNGTATLYSTTANSYLKADALSGLVESDATGTKVGTFSMSEAKTFTISRTSNSGYDKLYDKYYIIYDDVIIKGPVYATEIDSLRTKAVEKDVPTKKGIIDELDNDSFVVSDDLNCSWTAINIDFTELVLANETKDGKPIDNSNKNADSIEVNGKTYYMDNRYVSFLDSRLIEYEKRGVNVVGIVISFSSVEAQCNYPRALKYIDKARYTNGFNTSNDLGRDYFIAGMEYLANRYSKGGKGLICNYVIGNEVDYAYDWNKILPNEIKDGVTIESHAPFETYMEEYNRALRLANLAVKKYTSDVNVGISTSKEWAKSRGEQTKAKPEKNKRYDSYAPKDMLDWLNYYTKKSGDFDWSITPHNYPLQDGYCATYEIERGSIKGDIDTSKMITQNNMEIFQMYLDRKQNLYNGSPREVFLTENGCSSGSDIGTPSIEMQKEHAAAVAQLYYRAASLPSVKALIYYKINDRAEEGATSFKLGLKDTNGNKKLAYNVWKYIDTNRSFQITNKYLNNVSFVKDGIEYSVANGNISSWYDVMHTVNSSFDWSKYWNEEVLLPIQLEETTDVASLKTDKTTYGADDPILVTATGSSTDTVGLYKKGEKITDGAIYSYEVGGEHYGKQLKSGKEYDIRAYGTANIERLEDAQLPAGDYSVILSSGEEELAKIDIQITGTSAFKDTKTLATNKTTYKTGEDIIVTASGDGSDWVGIYKKGEKPAPVTEGGTESIYWYYVNNGTTVSGKPFIIQNGTKNANSKNPQAVIQPGEYFVVLLENDGYTELARVSNIIIQPGEAQKLSSIEYVLENETDGFANGKVTITQPEGGEATDCLMYWGDVNGEPLKGYSSLAKFRLQGEKTTETMQPNTIIPPEAKTLLAYAVASGKTSAEPVVATLPEGAAYVYDSESNETLRFAVGSDIHLVTPGSGNDYNLNTNHHFTIAMQDIVDHLPGAEHFFINGDIADHGKASEYKVAMNLIQSVEGAPTVHMAIGNHDWRTGNPDGQFQKYVNWFNPAVETEEVYYDEWVDGYHYIYLGSEDRGEVAILSQKQLDWLDNLLAEDAENDPERPVFIFLHQGIQDSMAGNYPGQWGYSYGIAQDAKLKKIVQKYGQAVMFGGHTHYELDTDNSVTVGNEELPVYVNTGAVGYLWDAYNTAAGEYMEGAHGYHVKVFGNKIYMFGRNFITGEYMPSAMYVIDPVKLSIVTSKINMAVGDVNVNVGAETADDMQLTYKSSNTKVVQVDYSGNLRAVGKGTAKVYVSTESTNTKAINRRFVTVTVE